VMSFSIVSTSMTLKDSELPKQKVFIDLCDEMVRDRLTVCEQELL